MVSRLREGVVHARAEEEVAAMMLATMIEERRLALTHLWRLNVSNALC